MDAEQSGRLSLKLDAVYCAVVGGIVTVGARRLRALLRIPPPAVLAAGAATVAWAGLVSRLSSESDWRRGVGLVAAANLFAACSLGAAAVRQPTRAGRLSLAAVATDVASFAVWQAIVLRTSPSDHLGAVQDNGLRSRLAGSAD